jgi:hypothetical protein
LLERHASLQRSCASCLLPSFSRSNEGCRTWDPEM